MSLWFVEKNHRLTLFFTRKALTTALHAELEVLFLDKKTLNG